MKTIIFTLSLLFTAVVFAAVEKGDTLAVSIKGVPAEEQSQINGNYMVTKKGELLLPFLDKVPIVVEGLDHKVIAKAIEKAYVKAGIYTQPSIAVDKWVRRPHRDPVAIQKFITVSGQVGRPGPQAYRKGLTLIDVVSAAGPTTFAAQNRVELLRNGKVYKYNMKVSAHMAEKVYPNDKITLRETNMWSK